jgi:hypothetical protein
MRGVSVERSTIVLSRPISHSPPSSTIGTASPNSSRTCAAVVGDSRPNRFAEGAATPPSKARSRAWATGCAGTRRPTVSCPPVTSSGTLAARGRIRVSGPGQKASASASAASGQSPAQREAVTASATWTISGWSEGRPFSS